MIKDLISLILIDVDEKYVVEEWYIPTEAETPVIFTGILPEDEEYDYGEPLEGQLTLEDFLELKMFINEESD